MRNDVKHNSIMIRLHGKNDRELINGRCYYTDAEFLREEVRLVTGRDPFVVNVTSDGGESLFRLLSPMLSGETDCYLDSGRMLLAKSVEVAWQYSKIYSEIVTEGGEHKNVLRENLRRDACGRLVPSEKWLAWRDTAFQNPLFDSRNEGFDANKPRVRRAYDRPSKAEFWWWNGEILDAITARQKIYATLYRQYATQTPGFKRLQEIVANGDDLVIFDYDGYDWKDLGMTPADCVQDRNHSFGHGLVINLLLENHDPTNLVPATTGVQEKLEQEYERAKTWRPARSPRAVYVPQYDPVIHLAGEYKDTQLCDGPHFSLALQRNDRLIPVSAPLLSVRKALLRLSGEPRFKGMKRSCVIFGDPLVDAAGTPEQGAEAFKICREILDQTDWTIRLQSANDRLEVIARHFTGPKDKARMIFGMVAGDVTDDSGILGNPNASPVLARAQVLKQLQKEGFRTFARLSRLLPQSDPKDFVTKLIKRFALKDCEHVWAEMLPLKNFGRVAAALRGAGRTAEAEMLEAMTGRPGEWQRSAEGVFLALAAALPKKLRFLQPVEKADWPVWEKHQARGAILLGDYARQIRDMDGKCPDIELVRPLNEGEKKQLAACLDVVRKNLTSFVAVGMALKTIRDRKLYREAHSSFESYCLANFNFTYSYGFRLIKSAELVEELKPRLAALPIGNELVPTTESQARELMKVEPRHRVEVLKLAYEKAGGRALSAVRIEQAALVVQPPKGKKSKPARNGTGKLEIELDAFLAWLGHLKSLALDGRDDEIVRLLQKAEQDWAIALPSSATASAEAPTRSTPTGSKHAAKLTVNWRDCYDNYDWDKGTQKPMTHEEKANVEELAVKILGLKPDDLVKGWATAYPPGCFAQTVIHVNHGMHHRFSKNGKPVGLKIFNLKRGQNEWRSRLKTFYSTQRSKLPGLPNSHFQEVIAYGNETDSQGDERGYLIQEWVEGELLETLVAQGLKRKQILNILDDLFLGMIIPLWAKGTKWWDARRSNYVVTPRNHLVMIDPDTLADYAAEIATEPAKYTKRNTCAPNKAMERYKALIIDMAANCPEVKDLHGLKSQVKKLSARFLDEPFRCHYPLPGNWADQATAAYRSFKAEFDGILAARSRTPSEASRRRTRRTAQAKNPAK